MFKRFLPRRDIFFVFFEQHAGLSYKAAKHLLLLEGSKQEPAEIFQDIKAIEHEADIITHQCVEALHKTFITPMDRLDIYRLITTLDDIVDEIEDIAKFFVLYKLESLRKDAVQMAEILIASTQEVQSAVRELRQMKITEVLSKHFFTINHLENEADTLFMQALGRLFEESMDTKTLIKWKEIYEHLEIATDVCEDVSNILEGIILENE